MRHNKKFNHLSRKKGHREALLANMTCSLIFHKKIVTTVAKAKALRMYAEPLINRAKTDDTANRRLVFSYLKNKDAVTELFKNIALKIADRPGGYTRILKLGNRIGDNAQTCFIELVDYNEALLAEKKEASSKKKTTRRSRRSTKKADEAPAEAVEAAAEEAPKAEAAPAKKAAPKAKKAAPAKEAPKAEEAAAPAEEEAPKAEEAPKDDAPKAE